MAQPCEAGKRVQLPGQRPQKRLYRDNGKENGNYRDYRGYIGVSPKKWGGLEVKGPFCGILVSVPGSVA